MTSDALLHTWALAFAATQLIEVPIWVVTARAGRAEPGVVRLAAAAAVCTAVTHPLLWFAWPRIVGVYSAYLVSGEVLVVAVETVLFRLLARSVPWSRCLAAGLLANGASLAAGLFVRALVGG